MMGKVAFDGYNNTGEINVIPTNIYLLKIKNKSTRKRCQICSKVIIKTPEHRHLRRYGVFIFNSGHISHVFLKFFLFTLNK